MRSEVALGVSVGRERRIGDFFEIFCRSRAPRPCCLLLSFQHPVEGTAHRLFAIVCRIHLMMAMIRKPVCRRQTLPDALNVA